MPFQAATEAEATEETESQVSLSDPHLSGMLGNPGSSAKRAN